MLDYASGQHLPRSRKMKKCSVSAASVTGACYYRTKWAADGSFPLELERTKPYGYSLFNLDAMTTLCHLLTTPEENLWDYTTTDGRNIEKGISWLFPFVKDKGSWQRQPDIMFWEEWPVAHPFLLFGSLHHYRKEYFQTWKQLEHFPTNEEVIQQPSHPSSFIMVKLIC